MQLQVYVLIKINQKLEYDNALKYILYILGREHLQYLEPNYIV